MREIKFRAWYQNKMNYNITKAHYEHNAMSGHGGDLWDLDEWLKLSKVMQYTGMKDRNDKEIYEGDIILCTYHTAHNYIRKGIVEYFASSFILNWGDQTDENLDEVSAKLEVIGNIFENPELLE